MESNNRILSIDEMPVVSGVLTPREFYTVLQQPAPLAGMLYPVHLSQPEQVMHELAKLGFSHIICLNNENPSYPVGPLNRLGSVDLDDLFGGRIPDDEEGDRRKILEMTDLALDRLKKGEGVVVHCYGGIGRTGTVLGAILVRLGHDPEQVIEQLDQLNKARNRAGWPESPWQANLLRSLKA